MSKFDSPLKNIKVASPCSASWDEMYGDARKRFCGDCKLNVYNLSGMTLDEAEALVMNAEGRLCVRFYKRADGSVITQDCPVGWAKIKQRTRMFATAAFSLLMAVCTGVFFVSMFSSPKETIGKLKMPFTTPTPEMQHTMGAVAINPNSYTGQKQPQPTMGNMVAPQKEKMRTSKSKLAVAISQTKKEI